MASEEQGAGFGVELELGEGDRTRLGLAEGEALRVLHSGGRVVLLEKTGADPDGALPWDRDLVLNADVRAFPLADVLRMLHDAGKSGYLSYADGDVEKSVYLHRGEVVFAGSNQPVDRLGECLLRAGEISLTELNDAEQRWSPGIRIGKVLVEKGILSPRELWNGVKLQVEEIVRSLFTHTSGLVHFWEGAVQPDNVVRLSLPTRRLIAEGLSRRDELLRFVASLDDPRVRLVRGDPEAVGQRKGNVRLLVEALAHEHTFQGACRRSGLDPLTGARAIQLLCLIGALEVKRSSSSDLGVAARKGDEAELRECILDHLKLLSELASPLVALEGTAVVGRRLGRVIEESASRHPHLFGDVPLSPAGVPDPEELTARALRLPGDRQQAVTQALGELVAYVEFELKNSPLIEEPDRFLDAVEPLRAKLELSF